jgi:hypothetical protein
MVHEMPLFATPKEDAGMAGRRCTGGQQLQGLWFSPFVVPTQADTLVKCLFSRAAGPTGHLSSHGV